MGNKKTYITQVIDITLKMFTYEDMNKTSEEFFASIPPAILRRLIRLSRKIILPDLPSPSLCWDYNFCMLMCKRAEQTLADRRARLEAEGYEFPDGDMGCAWRVIRSFVADGKLRHEYHLKEIMNER